MSKGLLGKMNTDFLSHEVIDAIENNLWEEFLDDLPTLNKALEHFYYLNTSGKEGKRHNQSNVTVIKAATSVFCKKMITDPNNVPNGLASAAVEARNKRA